jgi:hypothetical protein
MEKKKKKMASRSVRPCGHGGGGEEVRIDGWTYEPPSYLYITESLLQRRKSAIVLMRPDRDACVRRGSASVCSGPPAGGT